MAAKYGMELKTYLGTSAWLKYEIKRALENPKALFFIFSPHDYYFSNKIVLIKRTDGVILRVLTFLQLSAISQEDANPIHICLHDIIVHNCKENTTH